MSDEISTQEFSNEINAEERLDTGDTNDKPILLQDDKVDAEENNYETNDIVDVEENNYETNDIVDAQDNQQIKDEEIDQDSTFNVEQTEAPIEVPIDLIQDDDSSKEVQLDENTNEPEPQVQEEAIDINETPDEGVVVDNSEDAEINLNKDMINDDIEENCNHNVQEYVSDEIVEENHQEDVQPIETEPEVNVIESDHSIEEVVADESTEEKKEDKPKVEGKVAASPFTKGGDTNKAYCLVCEKVAYPLEQFRTKLGVFHKTCFKCTKCNKTLTPANYSFNNDKPFCTPHYLELFKKRGKYDDSDDVSAENTERAESAEPPINEAGDELPAPETTKSLIANIESRQYNVTVSGNRDNPENLPTENITKKLAEKFAAMGKTPSGTATERAAPIDIKSACTNGNGVHQNGSSHIATTNGTNGTHFSENEPKQLDKDVVRADQPLDDNKPKEGTAKMMAQRFNQEVA